MIRSCYGYRSVLHLAPYNSCICNIQTEGMMLMAEVANSTSKRARHMLRASQYNLGRAHYQGFGVQQSDDSAEK